MLAHLEFGSGPDTVLFLHGLFGRGHDLDELARAVVGAGTRALIPDLLAHGDSPQLPPQADLETMARALVQWLDALGYGERLPVVAHSMGGRVALRLHDLEPSRLGPFVLLDTPAGAVQEKRSPLSPFFRALAAAPESAESADGLLDAFGNVIMGDSLRAWLRSRIVRTDGGYSWNLDRQALVDYRNRTLDEDLFAIVEQLGPTNLSVFAPKVSVYVRRAEKTRYAECGVEVQTVERAGHDLYNAPPASLVADIRARLAE